MAGVSVTASSRLASALSSEYMSATVWTLWLVAWCAGALAVGYVGSANQSAQPEFVAAGVVALGPWFAALGRLARRLSRDRGYVLVELRTYRLAPLWTTMWFGLAAAGGWAIADDVRSTMHHAFNFYLGIPALLASGLLARLTTRPTRYFRIDVPAGIIEGVGFGGAKGTPLAHWVPLVLRPHHSGVDVVAPSFGVAVTLEISLAAAAAVRTRVQGDIDELTDRAALHRVLSEVPVAGGAFRSGPDLATAAHTAIPDPARLAYAVKCLAQDPDPAIRERARTLATAA